MPGRQLPLLFAFGLTIASVIGPARAADPCADHVPQPKPQNAGRDIVGQDLDTIKDRGFMTFAVYEEHPPYSWEDGGQARGVDVEIARLIAEDLGVEARFNFVAAGENLVADLRNYVWKGPLIGGSVSNVMMRVPYNSAFTCRVEQVVFTGQYANERIAIAYREADYPDGGPTVPFFRFDSVAVENDSISDFYLSSFAGGRVSRNVRRLPSASAAMDALELGEVMAAMGPLAQLEHGLSTGLAVHLPPLPGFAVSRWTLGVGVHFAYRPLSYSVDDAIFAALADGRISEIYEEYGLTHGAPER